MKRASGFTLVEVVVAAAVLSLVMLATVTAMRTFGRAGEQISDRSESLVELRRVSEVLRQYLSQAHVGGGAINGGGTWAGLQRLQSVYFAGSASELTWLAPVLGAGRVSGLYYLRLYRDGPRLMLDMSRFNADADEPDWEVERITTVLLRDIDLLEVAYRADADGEWLSSFAETERSLPQAIRLRLRSDGRYWPDIVVAPPGHSLIE